MNHISAVWPSGEVQVCNTFYVGSNPTAASVGIKTEKENKQADKTIFSRLIFAG